MDEIILKRGRVYSVTEGRIAIARIGPAGPEEHAQDVELVIMPDDATSSQHVTLRMGEGVQIGREYWVYRQIEYGETYPLEEGDTGSDVVRIVRVNP